VLLLVAEPLEFVLAFSTFLIGLVVILLSWQLFRTFQGGKVATGYYALFVATLAFGIHSLIYFLFNIAFSQEWVQLANLITHLATAIPFALAVYWLSRFWKGKI